eukprot:1960547-Pleurochrysis_carterae.AAC.1
MCVPARACACACVCVRSQLSGAALLGASGKLAVLDRLLSRVAHAKSRVLIFSAFTQSLDLLQ